MALLARGAKIVVSAVGKWLTDACAALCCEADAWVFIRSCVPGVQTGPCPEPETVDAWFRYSLKDQNGDPIGFVLGDPSFPSPTAPVFYYAGRCWVAQHGSPPVPRSLTGGTVYDVRAVTLLEERCEAEECDWANTLAPMRQCGTDPAQNVPGTVVYVCPVVASMGVVRLPADEAETCEESEDVRCYCAANDLPGLTQAEAVTAGYRVWLNNPCASGYPDGCCECVAVDIAGPCMHTAAPVEPDEFAGTGDCCCPRTGNPASFSAYWKTVITRSDPGRPFDELTYEVTHRDGVRTIKEIQDGVYIQNTSEPVSTDLSEQCSRSAWAAEVRGLIGANLYLPPFIGPETEGYTETVSCSGATAGFDRTDPLLEEDGVTSYGSIAWFSQVTAQNPASSTQGCVCQDGSPAPDPLAEMAAAWLENDLMGGLPA